MTNKLEQLMAARKRAEMNGDLAEAQRINLEIIELGKARKSEEPSEPQPSVGDQVTSGNVMTQSRGLVTGSKDSKTGLQTSLQVERTPATDPPSPASDDSEDASSED